MATRETNHSLSTFLTDRKDLLALAHSIVGCSHTAEDLVQDGWVKWQLSTYPADRAKPILRKIIANLAMDWHRKKRRERNSVNAQLLYEDISPDSEQIVMARQHLAAVVKALATLPPTTRLALKLHRIDGLTYREIGARLNICHTHAFKLVAKALSKASLAIEL
ncbi:MAG: sigma-70 family RNA polymerase sigma factor [Pseudomonadota bacterium]